MIFGGSVVNALAVLHTHHRWTYFIKDYQTLTHVSPMYIIAVNSFTSKCGDYQTLARSSFNISHTVDGGILFSLIGLLHARMLHFPCLPRVFSVGRPNATITFTLCSSKQGESIQVYVNSGWI